MATNETILTGRKFRKCIDAVNKKWNRYSFWSKASDCEFNDGKDAENKLGTIDGITDSLASDSSRIAASAKAVSTLNKNLGGLIFAQDTDGNWGYKAGGADTVHPFNKYKYSAGILKIDKADQIYTISIGWTPKVIAMFVGNTSPFLTKTPTRLQLYVADQYERQFISADEKGIALKDFGVADGLYDVFNTGFQYRYAATTRYLYYWAVG